MVGQRFVALLEGHPWFQLTALAASDRSVGRPYGEVVRWRLSADVPVRAGKMVVLPCQPELPCEIVFSALDASVAAGIEQSFARAGYAVLSNSRNHRMEPDVPLLIPEVNPEHLDALSEQRSRRGWRGCIVTNPNCSTIGLVLALAPLHRAFGVEKVDAATMQALSGAGYPGIPSMDAADNIIPFIAGEEEKMEIEAGKILGEWRDGAFHPASFALSAHCHRVGTIDGHLAAVSVKLARPATPEQAAEVLAGFRGAPQELELPSAPDRPIRVRTESDRPQTRLDRDEGAGMTAVVGRMRNCPTFDIRFCVLSHNTVRGAAGAAILNAELMASRGLLGKRAR
jgi:aspartate-semialdehyde dehydrogenase